MSDWIPKVGEKFEAFLRGSGKRHFASPFKRIAAAPSENKKYIYAKNFRFDPELFYFEKPRRP